MRINGVWQLDEHEVTEPVLFGRLQRLDSSWIPAAFLIDTGAERTLLSPDILEALGFVATPSRHQFVGLGGAVDVWTVQTKLRLDLDSGSHIDINGPFDGLHSGREGEMSILGRDVIGHFATIFDRPADTITLLHGRHRYSTHEQ